MSTEYTKKIRLRSQHVDCFRKLKLSVLMQMFQECCIAHTEELGMGRAKTLDRGFLWIINSETIEIDRLPEYDEEITMVCYPGSTLHYFFPRQMAVYAQDGSRIIRIGALWSLIDEKTRQLIDPGANGIVIHGENRSDDVQPALSLPAKEMPPASVSRHAAYSLIDINGHISNSYYLDLVQDLIGFEDLQKFSRQKVRCVFRKEIPAGTDFEIRWGKSEQTYRFQNEYFLIEIDQKSF